jgi:hypothetical protein
LPTDGVHYKFQKNHKLTVNKTEHSGVNDMKEPSRKHTSLSGQYNQIMPIPFLEHEFSYTSCKAGSQKDLIEVILPAPTAIKPEHQSSLNRFLNHFDDFSSWLLRKLLPKHLAQGPPPDRQIYY